MKVIEVELGKSEFSEENCYKIVFHEKHQTEFSTKSYEPSFNKKRFEILSNNFKEMKEFLKVTIIGMDGKNEVIKGKETVELAFGKDFVSHTVEFNKLRGASLDGVIHFSYKLYKQTLPESLKNTNGICCLSINAAYLNVVLEKPFDLKLLIKDHLGSVLGTARLNNRSPAFYLDMVRTPGDQPVELVVSDSSGLYSIMVRPGCPMASAIPLMTGDVLLVTTQLVIGVGVVTGMIHSSALREALVSTTTTGKRISLSPRRPSIMLSVSGIPGGEVSAKKSLLYLEDPLLQGSESASSTAVLEGVQQAMSISAADSQMPLNEQRLTAPIGGPRGGVYVTCSSKNEILLDNAADIGKKKSSKKNKRQLHVINLGLISVHISGLLSPVKLRAELLDYLLEPHGIGISGANSPVKPTTAITSSDSSDNPEMTSASPNESDVGLTSLSAPRSAVLLSRPSLAFSGLLEETSRELFNESGLVAIVLEGKLFRQSVQSKSNFSAINDCSINTSVSARDSMVAGSEETCMAVKVYLSLVPSSTTVEQSLEKTMSTSHVSSEILADTESLQTGLNESVSEKDIFAIDSEILDFGGYALNKSKRLESVSEVAPFNVVTEGNAQPDELTGSSVLTVPRLPLHPLAQEQKETVSAPYGSLERATSAMQFGEQLDPKHILHLQQLELEDQQRSRMIASNNTFAEIVRAELVEKQKLVEKLMVEVSMRSEAIQVVGKDIRELRQEKMHLLDKIESLEADLAKKVLAEQSTNQMTERMLKSSAALQDMDRDTLIRLLNQLRDALNASEGEKVQLHAVLRSAKTSLDEFAMMKRDYRELQGAHVEQTKYLQKMQSKINQVDVYRGTIATQEGVIASMQSAIEAKIHKHHGLNKHLLLPRPPKRMVVPVSSDKSADKHQSLAEDKLREAFEEVSTLEQRVRELEEQLELAKYSDSASDKDEEREEVNSDDEESDIANKKESAGPIETNRKIDQLEAELVSKGFRISALEKQLATSTVDYSREIARLRTKLFELEINSSLMAGDADPSFLSGDMGDFSVDGGDSSGSSRVGSAVGGDRSFVSSKVENSLSADLTAFAGNDPSIDTITVVSEEGSLMQALSEELQSKTEHRPSTSSVTPPTTTVMPSVDRVVERTVDIHDVSTESSGVKCADLTFKIRHVYDGVAKISQFIFQYIEIHGFQQSEQKAKFQPNVVLSMPGVKWSEQTDTKSEAGPNVVWTYENDEKCLTMTDEQLQLGATLQCNVEKFVAKSHSNFLIGTGTLSMLL